MLIANLDPTESSELERKTVYFKCSGVLSRARGRRGGLMVSALNLRASGPGSSPGRGHCVVFLGKTLYSHGASLHPGV